MTQVLLRCGQVILPLFGALVLAQVLFREGFTLSRHPLSLLALGPGGWVQTANFVVCGALTVLLALALWRTLPGVSHWAALLIVLHGAGLMLAGVFPADPAMGFPPGAPDGIPESMSRSASVHGMGFMLAFSSLTLACFVLAAMGILRGPGIVLGVAMPLLIWLGLSRPLIAGIPFFVAALLGFLWLFLLARDSLLSLD